MSIEITKSSELSDISLLILEDSGWYKTDLSLTERIEWGYLGGCLFGYQKCVEYGEPTSKYYCIDTEVRCSKDRKSFGNCNLIQYPNSSSSSQLPSQFQYFPGNPWLGGSSQAEDYCPTQSSDFDCRFLDNQPPGSFFFFFLFSFFFFLFYFNPIKNKKRTWNERRKVL